MSICSRFVIVILFSILFTFMAVSADFWQPIGSLTNTYSINSIVSTADGNLFAATYGGGILRSTNNGDNWEKVTTNIQKSHFFCLAISPNGTIYAGSSMGFAYRSTNNGSTWEQVLIDTTYESMISSFFFASNETVYVGMGSGLRRSVDGGNTWTNFNNGLLNGRVFSIIRDKKNRLLAGTYRDGIYQWNEEKEKWLNIGFPEYRINCFGLSSDSSLFIGTEFGVVKRTTSDTLKHMNSGLSDTVIKSWVPIESATRFYDTTYIPHFILSLAITPAGDLYATGYGDGVFKSTNGGEKWEDISSGISGGDLYVRPIALNSNGYLFTGTAFGKIYRSSTPVQMVKEPDLVRSEITMSIVLEQSYPNPFNPNAVIPFVLRDNGNVSLIIYNTTGQEVARLVDGYLSNGRYEINWDASDFPSGSYFYRVQSANTSQTGKLLLMK
ncbi:MAG: T9SS type A sorting domain-containing protein [Bacteroidota bacterium]|nr:T9SS type A sorting domain-containing protein [Bacteroidota bacterium]